MTNLKSSILNNFGYKIILLIAVLSFTFLIIDTLKSQQINDPYTGWDSHTDPFYYFKYNKSGTLLAGCGVDWRIRIWETSTGKIKSILLGQNEIVNSLDISSDENTIISGGNDNFINLFDIKTGNIIKSFNSKRVVSIVFSPNNDKFAYIEEDEMIIREINTGSIIYRYPIGLSKKSGINYSPDGTKIAFLDGSGEIKIIDSKEFKEIKSVGNGSYVISFAFSPDGTKIASAGVDGGIKIWDVKTGSQLYSFTAHPKDYDYLSVTFSPDGKKVASAGSDDIIKIWDYENSQRPLEQELICKTIGYTNISFSPDGNNIASSGTWRGGILIWDLKTSNIEYRLIGRTSRIHSSPVSPDGTLLATCSVDHQILLWDLRDNRPIYDLPFSYKNPPTCVAFSKNGKKLAAIGSSDFYSGGGIIWDVGTGQTLVAKPFGWNTGDLSFSPDGKIIAYADCSYGVVLWDINSGELTGLRSDFNLSSWTLDFSPDGSKLVVGHSNGNISIWDVKTWNAIKLFKAHAFIIVSIKFSPDGRRIASCGVNDSTVRIWDSETGENIFILKGHMSISIYSLSFSPDGKYVASLGNDYTIRIWNVNEGKLFKTIKFDQENSRSICFNPDGKKIYLCGEGPNNIRIYDVELPTKVENEISLPEKNILYQNYPNPFNPSTNIKYDLPKNSYVKLYVYDILGKEVATLSDGFKTVGSHEIAWDAGNLPSGIYYYKIIAGDYIQVRKMMLMK